MKYISIDLETTEARFLIKELPTSTQVRVKPVNVTKVVRLTTGSGSPIVAVGSDGASLAHELDGVIADVEQGKGFDAVCLETIKRVRALLAEPSATERALRACAIKYLRWLRLGDPVEALERDLHNPDMAGEDALSAQPAASAEPSDEENEAWALAEAVRSELDRQSCPDAFMRIAVESIVKHARALLSPASRPAGDAQPVRWLVTGKCGNDEYTRAADEAQRAKQLRDESYCGEDGTQVVPLYAAPVAAQASGQAQDGRPKDDALWDQTLRERDEYHDMADQLAAQIAAITGEEIGEHSSANCPWRNAMLAADDYIADKLRSLCDGHAAQAQEPRTDAGRAAALIVAKLAETIPLKDTLAATSSGAAMVDYFKRLVSAQAPGPQRRPTWDELRALAVKHGAWVPGYGPFAAELLATYGSAPSEKPEWVTEWLNAMHAVMRTQAPAALDTLSITLEPAFKLWADRLTSRSDLDILGELKMRGSLKRSEAKYLMAQLKSKPQSTAALKKAIKKLDAKKAARG